MDSKNRGNFRRKLKSNAAVKASHPNSNDDEKIMFLEV